MKRTLLIDTQILIWSIIEPTRLNNSIKILLAESNVLISQVSLIEIAMKQAVGKIPGFNKTTFELTERVIADGFHILPITNQHINTYASIPLYQQHKDPFDRLLLAVALSEKLSIVSADGHFKLYSSLVDVIEA